MLFIGRGDEHLRASHDKTLELSTDDAISARATCVVCVAARTDDPPMAGPVTVTVRAGGIDWSFDAEANSGWDPNGPAVIRRSAVALPGTLATQAGAAAADVPRELVHHLQQPHTRVQVQMTRRRSPVETVVLLHADPHRAADAGMGARLAAELAAADVVLTPDDAAARLVTAARVPRASIAAADGVRTLVVATRSLPALPHTMGTAAVRTVGLTAQLAAVVAAPWPGPTTFAPADGDARWWRAAQQVLRSTPRTHRVVIGAPRADVPRLLAAGSQLHGSAAAVLTRDDAPPQLLQLGADHPPTPDLAGSERVFVCFAPASDADGDAVHDPAVRAAVAGLRADGVGARAAARALATLTGMGRRDAYDTVLNWTDR